MQVNPEMVVMRMSSINCVHSIWYVSWPTYNVSSMVCTDQVICNSNFRLTVSLNLTVIVTKYNSCYFCHFIFGQDAQQH